MTRAIILILDSFGIGATPDADRFDDVGANTLGSIARLRAAGATPGPLRLPNLTRLGLMHAARDAGGAVPEGCRADGEVSGAWGYARELSTGKDTPSGHWELAGVPVLFEWGTFPQRENSFPPELLNALVERAELPGVLGNKHSSGTVILTELGEEHMRSGKPIFYTSIDSVFQIAAHEDSFGLERLYRVCEIARELVNDYNVGRVIARPFVGSSAADFERTGNRRDLSVLPPAPTVLDKLVAAGGQVIGIGKIGDIFAYQGITRSVKANGNAALIDATLQEMATAPDNSIVFTNLVDFDMLYGHRRDAAGYADALEYFDSRLPEITAAMRPDDILVLSADHGCDPAWPGSDHTREHIPVLVSGDRVRPRELGARASFADVGQSLASFFDLEPMDYGESFLDAPG